MNTNSNTKSNTNSNTNSNTTTLPEIPKKTWTRKEFVDNRPKKVFPPPASVTFVKADELLESFEKSGEDSILVAEGTYIGGKQKEMISKRSKQKFLSKRRMLKEDDDNLVIIFSNGQLEYKFKKLEEDPKIKLKRGDRIAVFYRGMQEMKAKPGRIGGSTHTYAVTKLSSGDSGGEDLQAEFENYEEELSNGELD